MTKCPHCGFDPKEDSIYTEGAPCGVNGCHEFTCCQKSWMEHCKISHPEYYKKALEK